MAQPESPPPATRRRGLGRSAAVVVAGVLTLAGLGVIRVGMPEFERLELRLDEAQPA